jgi:hypothetical protein
MKIMSKSRPTAKAFFYCGSTMIAIVVAGCVSESKITSTANGVYVIQGRAVGPWNADKERIKALKQATAYCMRKSQRVLLHDIDEKDRAVHLVERATITFECES